MHLARANVISRNLCKISICGTFLCGALLRFERHTASGDFAKVPGIWNAGKFSCDLFILKKGC